MSYKKILVFLPLAFTFFQLMITGCGQPLPPTGGPKDTLPPVLARSAPAPATKNFSGNRIVLEFDEYVTVENPFEKLIFSPVPKSNPVVEGKLKTVTIRLKDTLEPNTTYSIDFGNAIKDVNENNILRNFRYIFSTGPVIDSLELSGRVFIAETGKTDSTFIAVLHRSTDDSAVAKQMPRYYTRLDKDGNFTFRYLAPGQYRLFALGDADGGKKYDQQSEFIAFMNEPVTPGQTKPVIMYAFTEVPEEPEQKASPSSTPAKPGSPRNKDDKRLKYSTTLDNGRQDILNNLVITFENPLARYDSSKLLFTDEEYKPITNYSLVADTTPLKLILKHQWEAGKKYNLILQKDFAADSAGNSITRTDTLDFMSKREVDYGGVRINISNLDTNLHPILLFFKGDKQELAVPMKTSRIQYKLFSPGEYQIRILYDSNNNGKWDTGNYWQKLQPERVVARKQTLNIRPNWDNEFEINLLDLGN